MQLHRVDLNLLVVFEAIYTHGSITRASTVLFITQPAVSNALARLRKLCDDELFYRSGRQMQPTARAQAMIGPVRQALGMLSQSLQGGTDFVPDVASRTFRLSMADIVEAIVLPQCLPALLRQAPDCRLHSYPVERSNILQQMDAGQLDLAIDVPQPGREPLLQHVPLLQDRYVCVLRAGHPLLEHGLDMDSYLALQHVHVSSRRQGAGHIDLHLEQLGVKRQISMRARHYLLVPPLISQSDLAATLPERLALQLDLPFLPLPFVSPVLTLHLYWSQRAEQDPATMWLKELILQVMTDAGQSTSAWLGT